MKLAWEPVPPVRANAVPAASLAILVLGLLAVAGAAGVVRGVGFTLRPSPASERGGSTGPVLVVDVEADGATRVQGASVPRERIADAARLERDRSPGALVVLRVDPEASYASMVEVAAALLASGADPSDPSAVSRLAVTTARP